MAGNSRSGPRKPRDKEKAQIAAFSGRAMSVIMRLAEDKNAPPAVQLQAAIYLLNQHMGAPRQRLGFDGEDGGPLEVIIRRANGSSGTG